MSRECGRCLVEFPGVDGALLAWCNKDGFFVCGRCVRECRRIHGTPRKTVGTPVIVTATMVLFLFSCFAPSLVPLAYEASRLSAWQAMPISNIGSTQMGQTVKISGGISSDPSYAYPVALSGQEVRGRGCSWNWDEGARFVVADPTGTILVAVDRYWEIADGVHPNPYETCAIPESEYWVGDAVVILGTVEPDGFGGVLLRASIVSPDAAHPVPNLIGWLLVTPFLALCVALWVWLTVVRRRRVRIHRKALEGRPPQPLPPMSNERDATLPWRKTYGGSVLLDKVRYVALFAAVPFALPTLYVWFLNPHSQNQFYITALIATLAAFLSVTVLLSALVSRVKPSAMAVTHEGIHFWYERPVDRYELNDLVRWADVTDVKMVPVGKTQALAVFVGSEPMRLPGLPSAVQKEILAGWKDRATLPPP